MSIIILVLFVSLYLQFEIIHGDDIQKIQLDLQKFRITDDDIYINSHWSKIKANVPLRIEILNYPYKIYYISCWSYHSKENFIRCEKSDIQYDRNNYAILISNVTDAMSDTWVCGINYVTWIYYNYIYFDIFVNGARPPQDILINNVILPTRRDIRKYNKYTADYYYEDGDLVEVICIAKQQHNCTLNMYHSNLNTRYTLTKTNHSISMKMGDKQDSTYIVCTCSRDGHTQMSLYVTFKQHADNNGTFNYLKINGTALQSTNMRHNNMYNVDNYYLNYAYNMQMQIMNNELNIVFDTNVKNRMMTWYMEQCKKKGPKYNGTQCTLRVEITRFSTLTFKTYYYQTKVGSITITFTVITMDEYIVASINTTTGTSVNIDIEATRKWAPMVVGIVTIITVLTVIVVCKIRKRKALKREQDEIQANTQDQDGSVIPPHPAQSSSENTYASSYDYSNVGSPVSDFDAVYSTNSLYTPLDISNNIDYQNLELFSYPGARCKDYYAEVIPKSKRCQVDKTYANISLDASPDTVQHETYCNISKL